MIKNIILPITVFSFLCAALLPVHAQTIVDLDNANNFAPPPQISISDGQGVLVSPGTISIEPNSADEEKMILMRRSNALNIVLSKNDAEALKELCASSCHINEALYMGNNVLHMAARYGNTDMYKYAIEKQAAYKPNNLGETPLHLAAFSGNIELMDYILNSAKDSKKVLNEKTKDGQTALFYALKNYHNKDTPAVFLLGKGLDCNAQDKAQQTAMHHAMVNKKEEYFLKFMQLGCNLNILDKDLVTPLDLAMRYSFDFNLNQQLKVVYLQRPQIPNALDMIKGMTKK